MARAPKDPNKLGRTKQIRQAYQMTRRIDPKIGLVLLGVFLGVLALFLVIGFLVGKPIYLGILGLLVAIPAATIVFSRRAEKAAYSQVEGQPGAAAAVLNTIRGKWTVTPAVAVTRSQDIVHRVVGRPGIVLVGEGDKGRVASLFAQEKKKLARVCPEIPVYDVLAGTGEDKVPLRKLQSHLLKLPRTLTPQQVVETNSRLRALRSTPVPVPKGPLPRNVRLPKGPRG